MEHSFISRLDHFMRENVNNANSRLDKDKFKVIVLRVSRLACSASGELYFEAVNCIVFVQIGGNDIRNICNNYSIISAINSFAESLIHAKNVRHVRTTFTTKTRCSQTFLQVLRNGYKQSP